MSATGTDVTHMIDLVGTPSARHHLLHIHLAGGVFSVSAVYLGDHETSPLVESPEDGTDATERLIGVLIDALARARREGSA